MSEVDKYQQKLKLEIDSKAGFMSDAKWKALFSVLKEVNLVLRTNVKLLLDDTIREFIIPDPEDFINEKYIEEYWGVFELKEIEWMLITPEKKTHSSKLLNVLDKGKQFEYETSELGIKVFGYK